MREKSFPISENSSPQDELIKKASALLNGLELNLFNKYFRENLTPKQIAELSGDNPSTISSKIHRIKQKLGII